MSMNCKIVLFIVLLCQFAYLVMQAVSATWGRLIFYVVFCVAIVALMICMFV